MKEQMYEYAVFGGLHGYMPSFWYPCADPQEGAEIAKDTCDLSNAQARELEQNGYIELDLWKSGVEYVMIDMLEEPISEEDVDLLFL